MVVPTMLLLGVKIVESMIRINHEHSMVEVLFPMVFRMVESIKL